jgi:hypothetical protein
MTWPLHFFASPPVSVVSQFKPETSRRYGQKPVYDEIASRIAKFAFHDESCAKVLVKPLHPTHAGRIFSHPWQPTLP